MITDFKIFEHIKNPKLMNFYLDDTLSKIEKWCKRNSFGYELKITNNIDEKYLIAKFRLDDEKKSSRLLFDDDKKRAQYQNFFEIKTKKFLNSLKGNLLNHNIILSYEISIEWWNIFILRIYLKNIKIERIKPDKYLYHSSEKKFRDSIMKHGLIPKYAGNWTGYLEYPPAVFAINGVDSKGNNYWRESLDIWEIDTTNLPNQWWSDLNLGSDKGHIMTFDSIPPKYLTLFRKEIELD